MFFLKFLNRGPKIDTVKLPARIAEFFREQGRKGGKKSAAALTPEERSARAKKASRKAAKVMTPEERRARALKAVAAREAKRRAKKSKLALKKIVVIKKLWHDPVWSKVFAPGILTAFGIDWDAFSIGGSQPGVFFAIHHLSLSGPHRTGGSFQESGGTLARISCY